MRNRHLLENANFTEIQNNRLVDSENRSKNSDYEANCLLLLLYTIKCSPTYLMTDDVVCLIEVGGWKKCQSLVALSLFGILFLSNT